MILKLAIILTCTSTVDYSMRTKQLIYYCCTLGKDVVIGLYENCCFMEPDSFFNHRSNGLFYSIGKVPVSRDE